ncbi:hypothetical protein VNO80_18945 [Phaseolus coccineus]|uniref:Uncharacterized protein n=1 Tax=Phaseolus coccineus TaxID=3886 RepID=A0AAN9MK93_PHACN
MKLRLEKRINRFTYMAKGLLQQRIWGDIKMVKAYLLWSIDGLAAAPHCGIVGEHIIHSLPFNSPTASLQLLTPAHQKSQPSSLSIITFFHPFDS